MKWRLPFANINFSENDAYKVQTVKTSEQSSRLTLITQLGDLANTQADLHTGLQET